MMIKLAARLTAFVLIAVMGVSRLAFAQAASDLDPRIVKMIAAISEEHLGATLKKLESFETRSSLSSTTSTTSSTSLSCRRTRAPSRPASRRRSSTG